MSAGPEPHRAGFVESLGRLFGRVLDLVRNRAELFAVELHEEEHRFVKVLVLTGSALLLAFLALVLFTAVIILLFPPAYRGYVAVALGALFLTGAALLLARARAQLRQTPFAETINQLKKDAECLSPPK